MGDGVEVVSRTVSAMATSVTKKPENACVRQEKRVRDVKPIAAVSTMVRTVCIVARASTEVAATDKTAAATVGPVGPGRAAKREYFHNSLLNLICK